MLHVYPTDVPFNSAEYFLGHPSFSRMRAASITVSDRQGAVEALRTHWPEYLMEAAALGMFMVSACVVSVVLEHPASLVHLAISNPLLQRVSGGIAMGLTAVGIISSPWGQRSGAHMNPALTLTFLSLGKVAPWDALFYVLAQFAGGISGVVLSRSVIGPPLAHASINYVATVPGTPGPWVAFGAEFFISFLLVAIILSVSNSRRTARFTPWVAGFLVAAFISIEAPLSGMSMNPARTVGSALPSGVWTAAWVYHLAPPVAMVCAGQLYRRFRGAHRVFCAKFHHHNDKRCIFRCNYGAINHEQ
jgi:aquaporin Z